MATTGKRIIVTGASAGIGRAIALEYARRGARLVLAARRESELEAVTEEVGRLGGIARAVAVDVTAPDASTRIIAAADEAFGGFDTVIMNAGIGFPTFATAFRADDAERVMAVNYVSAVRMIEAALPRMLSAGAGQLVAMASLASFRGMPGSGAYNASKAALTIMMESLRTELRSSGVTITTVFPGFVRTDMTDQNEFTMPWLMEPDDAARRTVTAIERGSTDIRFPRPLAVLTRLSTFAPNRLYDWLVARGRERLRKS